MAKVRSDFESIYKWNVKDLFKSDDACKKELNKLNKDINKLKVYKGKILDNPNTLLELLNLDSNISERLERAYTYAHLNNDADTLNNTYQVLYGNALNTYSKYLEVSSFIVPELLKSDFNKIKEYMKVRKELKKYLIGLKHIYRNKAHVLSEDVESSLAIYSKVINSPEEIASSLTDSDLKFKSILVDGKECELTESNFSTYLRSKDRIVRKQAFENIYKEYENHKNTLANTLKYEVESNVASSKLRKFKNSLERSLFPNEIPSKVYYNLIDAVHNNMDKIYKYWDIKKKYLKLKDMHLYDTYVDVTKKSNKEYSYEDAKKLVIEATKVLGSDYTKIISSSFTNGWIDSCNNVGKRGGAYCTCAYGVHPYVLLSYEKELNDVSTLAHELGHAMHYYYATNNQSYENYNYSIFVAEVASQVNEILLCKYLLDNKIEDKMRIIDDLLQKYKSTIYRQTMFAEFELFIHEYTEKGGILTNQVMSDKYYELNKKYFGNNVIIDEEIKYEWERIPHFYMNFYVFMYSTGFAAATVIANEIYNGNKELRDNYLKFLKLGATKNPIDSLKVVGLDMKDTKVIDKSLEYMDELLNIYEKGSEDLE